MSILCHRFGKGNLWKNLHVVHYNYEFVYYNYCDTKIKIWFSCFIVYTNADFDLGLRASEKVANPSHNVRQFDILKTLMKINSHKFQRLFGRSNFPIYYEKEYMILWTQKKDLLWVNNRSIKDLLWMNVFNPCLLPVLQTTITNWYFMKICNHREKINFYHTIILNPLPRYYKPPAGGQCLRMWGTFAFLHFAFSHTRNCVPFIIIVFSHTSNGTSP